MAHLPEADREYYAAIVKAAAKAAAIAAAKAGAQKAKAYAKAKVAMPDPPPLPTPDVLHSVFTRPQSHRHVPIMTRAIRARDSAAQPIAGQPVAPQAHLDSGLRVTSARIAPA
eukprot:GEMP01095983.1.p1 GENE.GEMP01095983.1~~GEMP01095983.1.p1  ORF type:complete len:121 (+),score=23.38 GEMP01095983.1:26-364(+)